MALPRISRRQVLHAGAAGLLALTPIARAFDGAPPVMVGLDAEFFNRTSTADDAIELGARLAIEDINVRGGVLGGRPLQLVTTDNRSLPARGLANVQHLAAQPDIAAYLCGKFSPVVLEQLPAFHALELPLLNPWAAADAIVNNGREPNFAFRLGLRDSIAMERLLQQIIERGYRDVGVIVPASAWGRSSLHFAEHFITHEGRTALKLVGVEWHRWGSERSIEENYRSLVDADAQAILLVANEPEGAALVRALAELDQADQRPIFSHWGITGGRFPELCGPALNRVDLTVVQSFNFARASHPAAQRLALAAMSHFSVADPLAVPSMTGLGPAYDLIHLLALAIEQARSTHRPDIRAALERLPAYDGVVKHLDPAFTPARHEALERADVLLCQFDDRGRLQPIDEPR
ncbi:extracellular ligand-binding receptor [Thauera sp. 27]|uniref:ABC transporter substrate-binding protein n=1 Tax=Thauera sp. 27 TaxID=305700 RepID=UPI0002CEBE33|nr:ABC transporter substrate-binding protein [Thauera sp. 27]ENO82312.1 extracellular ligand-binding receptor [Thauera sp. 27]